jgi:hypothetical protein
VDAVTEEATSDGERRKAPWRKLAAAGLVIGLIAGGVVYAGGRDAGPASPPETSAAPTDTSAPPASTPPVTAGNGQFTSTDVSACTAVLSSIGAGNEFVPAVPYSTATGPRLVASGRYSTPQWMVELPESMQRQRLLGDPAPQQPGRLHAVSDGHIILFDLVDSAAGSRLGVYRTGSGELIWSAAVPSSVFVLVDEQRLYLIDHRNESSTTVVVVAPSLGQVVGCFAATGTPVPKPGPDDRTAVAAAGTLFVSFPTAAGQTVQSFTGTETRVIATTAPDRASLLGVVGEGETTTLLLAAGSSNDLTVTGMDPATGTVRFTRTMSELDAAPLPPRWGADARTAAVAADGSGLSNVEVIDALTAPGGALVALGTTGDAVRLVSMDPTGAVLWSAPVRRSVPNAWAVGTGVYHLTPTELRPNGEPNVAVIVDAKSGEPRALTGQLRGSSGIGTTTVAYPTFDEANPVVVFDGADQVGAVVGQVTSLSPVAAAPSVLLVYCEDGGKKFLVAYVLDAGSQDGPQS